MLYESVVERYAQAVFELSREQNSVKEWEEKLTGIEEAVRSHSFLKRALSSPRITALAKKDMLRKVFEKTFPSMLLNFLFILVDKGRENYLGAIVKKYREKVLEMEGTVIAQVTVAVPLPPSAERSLTQALSHYSKKNVRLECAVDPHIIGGVIVRMEGRIMDWSIAGHLENVKQKMISGLGG